MKKIEGWTDAPKELVSKPGTLRPFFTCEPSPAMTEAKQATLIIHDAEPEPVYLASEVRKMQDAGNSMCALLCLLYKEAANTLPKDLRKDLLALVNNWAETQKGITV